MAATKYISIKAKSADAAEISIYGEIGDGGFFSEGVGAKQFVKEIDDLGEIKTLDIFINSPGGSVYEGLAIYNRLSMHKAKKTVHIDGLAASIASVIAMSGDTIVMPENALMMIHDPWTFAMGNADEMRKTADVLDKMKDSLVMAYKGKSDLDEDEIKQMMTDETWMNGNDAMEKGFCDECTKPQKLAALAGFDLSKFKHVPQALLRPAAAIPIKPKKEVHNMAVCPKCAKPMVADECPHCEQEAKAKAELAQLKEKEINRAKALRAIGKEFKYEALAEFALEQDWTEDHLRTEILDRIKKKTPPGAPLNIHITPAHEGKPFRSFGEQLLAIKSAAHGHIDPRLREVYNAPTGAGESSPSDGEYLIQTDFTTDLLARSNETQVLAPRCKHIPISGNRLEAPVIDESTRATGSRWGGVQVYRAAEAAQVTAKKPKFSMLSMKLEKIMGLFYATEELLSDASALQAIAGQAFVEEFGFKIDDEIVNGTGAGQMLGLLNAGALVSVGKETGQEADTIIAENVMNMYSRMPARLIPGAEWYINQEIWPQLFKMQLTLGTGGVPLFMPPQGLSVAPYGTLMGRPIVPIEQAAKLGDQGDIFFANLSQFAIIEKGGIEAAQSIHVQFLTNETAFRWTVRNNGQPIWKSALTPYKGNASYTLSPFITLDARA